MQRCKDGPLIKELNFYFDILDFKHWCLHTALRVKVKLICSYHHLVSPRGPSGSTLIIKKRSLSASSVTGSVQKHVLSSASLLPKGTNTSHPRWPPTECAADNPPQPSLQQELCHLSEQSPTITEETSRGFRDNWSWLGHNLIYTKPPKS